MLKRLELTSIKSDLAAVEALLSERDSNSDPLGFLQYSYRAKELKKKLQQVEEFSSTQAEVGLFFGGRPVLGSYGIQADFSAKVINEFQTLVSSIFAPNEGGLGSRGPVPQRDQSQLMITDVARGSFGFILQEASDASLIDSNLKISLGKALDFIYRASSPDQELFESLAQEAENRIFSSLKSFFKILYDAESTLRIVDNDREFTLQRDGIELGRERTESVILNESDIERTGVIYILPESKRFELQEKNETLKGNISDSFFEYLIEDGARIRPGIIASRKTVILSKREMIMRGRGSKISYTLKYIKE